MLDRMVRGTLPARRAAPRPLARRRHRRAARLDARDTSRRRRQALDEKTPERIMPMTDVPRRFRAFRIHDDADGYRAASRRCRSTTSSPGEVVVRDGVFLGQLQGRAGRHRQGQDPAPLPAGRRHRRRRPRGRIDRSARSAKAMRCWSPAAACRETRDGGYSRIRAPRIAVGDPAARRACRCARA